MAFVREIGKNLGSVFLAFILAMVVWVTAVTAADPNVKQDYPRAIPISFEGQDPNLLLTQKSQTQVRLQIEAPRSVWTRLNNDETLLRVWVDLSNMPAGSHTVDVHVTVNARPARVIAIAPEDVQVTLEPLQKQTVPITLNEEGKPAPGYTTKETTLDPLEVTISGPESLVSKVVDVHTRINLANATTDVQASLPLIAYDAEGNTVSGVTLNPATVSVTIPVYLLGGYRNVVVKVETTGQVADGYKLTGILLSPPNVIVFSADPQNVNELPSYVETTPLSLAGLQDDFEAWLDLKLPDGVSVVGDSKVLVQVSIAAIESTLLFSLPVEVVGLGPELELTYTPLTIDVLLGGPVPVLNKILPSDVRAVIDLTSYEPGFYNLVPVIGPLPERAQVVSLNPATIAITIKLAPTPTPTPTVTPTPTPGGSSTPTLTPTPTPRS